MGEGSYPPGTLMTLERGIVAFAPVPVSRHRSAVFLVDEGNVHVACAHSSNLEVAPYQVSRARDQSPQRRHHAWMSRWLPYGMWTCGNGRQVLFNRRYQPIYERAGPDAHAHSANAREWVEEIVKQEYFFTDWDAPWRASEARRRCAEILVGWLLPWAA